MLSSFLCFSFVYVWHGTQNCILIWSALNFLGITLEMFIKKLNVKRRISCILASPLLAMSAISNFYFFAGTEIGNIFIERVLDGNCAITKRASLIILFSGGLSNVVLLFFLYQCCEVSTELYKLRD